MSARQRAQALRARYKAALDEQERLVPQAQLLAQRLVARAQVIGQQRRRAASGQDPLPIQGTVDRLQLAVRRLRARISGLEQQAERSFGALATHPRVLQVRLRLFWLTQRLRLFGLAPLLAGLAPLLAGLGGAPA